MAGRAHGDGGGARSRPAAGEPPVPPRRPAALGVDETVLVTGFVDLDRHRLLAVVEARTAQGGWRAVPPARHPG